MARQSVLPVGLNVEPIESAVSVRTQVYAVLKRAIIELDVYDYAEELRLDECQLSKALGVSRTPVREALAGLQQEGLVRSVPRRGVFIVRRTKSEIVEMIVAWAALESMAARFAATRATSAEFAELHVIMDKYRNEKYVGQINEYSAVNIAFHEKIVELGHCQTIIDMARNLFLHVQRIREVTIHDPDRAKHSVADHMNIIQALESRNAELAERLVREHALGLAAHVEQHADFLDANEKSYAEDDGR
ncbi:MAG: GntR family transcriptional regulator, partial [Terriglobia bacterium]